MMYATIRKTTPFKKRIAKCHIILDITKAIIKAIIMINTSLSFI